MKKQGFDPSVTAAIILMLVVATFFLPIWILGLSPFWSDLTYIHQAWRSSPAQMIQSGRLPLWETSLYLGMPMAASQQGGLFYPATIFYYLFGFVNATAAFHVFHFFISGWLTCLWLRSLKFKWGAAVGAAISLTFGGVMVSRIPLLNHLAVLTWTPALILFIHNPFWLALTFSLMYLAGYPTFIPGAFIIAWVLSYLLRTHQYQLNDQLKVLTKSIALALAFCSAQLIPSLELAINSRRATGIDLTESLTWGFTFFDLRRWISPLLVPLSQFHPQIEWWNHVSIGIAATLVALMGFKALHKSRAIAFIILFSFIALIVLGGSNRISLFLWEHFTPLKFVRYPGNFSYLALLPLAFLVSSGLHHLKKAPIWTLLIAAELLIFAWVATPLTEKSLFTNSGPLVRYLQSHLDGGNRYLMSPRALEATNGEGVVDWKNRLYGLTNAPYHIRAVANFGEPIVPIKNYAMMDMIYSVNGVDEAAKLMPWLGASHLLTPAVVASEFLSNKGKILWNISQIKEPVSTAYQFSMKEGAALPATLKQPLPRLGLPLAVNYSREDRFSISGQGEGWVYIAEPQYPGWKSWLKSSASQKQVLTSTALGAFQKVEVPPGPWELTFKYDPNSWTIGLWMSLLTFVSACLYGHIKKVYSNL